MFFVYVISSLDHKYIYVGIAQDVSKRLSQHNNGKEKTTRPYRPFQLILTEKYPNRIAAREREKQLKSGYGKEWLKKEFDL
jgi:putative endonuclease